MEVNGKNYTFLIGKRFVQIRDLKTNEKCLVKKNEIGFEVAQKRIVVTPKMIADYLKRGFVMSDRPEKYFHHCSHENRRLAVNPFAAEIYEKIEYGYWCQDCLGAMAEDI